MAATNGSLREKGGCMTDSNSRNTQRAKVLGRLIEARGEEIPAPELARIGGLQFQTRIWEIRHKLGIEVENRTERRDGQVLSWYRLVPNATAPLAPLPAPVSPDNPQSETLFGNISPERSYRE
jgi:hypothetical protein